MNGAEAPSRRYPGAPPFSDNELSRKLFHGRARETRELADVVLAQRLVVVYARSGMGKSSLLSAGLTELLWAENVLPISVRLNDALRGPVATLYESVEQAVKARGIEHVAGTTSSLWHCFKTAEFWRGDMLLTPLLLLDQFEELFTIQPPEAREAFIVQLAGLVRGVRPAGAVDDGEAPLSHAPPSVKVLISLREDYLGHLEELSTAIPEILDNRFRLGPLLEREARQAIVEPARLDDARLTSKPFQYAPQALDGIWKFLSYRQPGQAVVSQPYVEPFQLQLVCQRAEEIALDAQRRLRAGRDAEPVTITWDMLGGEPGLRATLASFYERQIASLATPRARRAARRLCQYGLISASGRRLSLEEGEIQRAYHLGQAALGELVERRLLRADTRVASVYYELSHDTLVPPILESRRRRESRRRLVRGAVALAVAVMILAPITYSGLSWHTMRRGLAARLEWTPIPAPAGGQFWMGCAPDDRQCEPGEGPRHQVALPRGFEMMVSEVTVSEFRRFAAASSGTFIGRWLPGGNVRLASQPQGSGSRHPVVYVSWHEASAFCGFGGGRLPTEAEWEYAARGGRADAVYPWGNRYSATNANDLNWSDQHEDWEHTTAVKSFPPNPFGLYDMAGNVWEWTSTVYKPYPYRSDDGRENVRSIEARVVRGGGFGNDPRHLRASSRKYVPSEAGDSTIGFRCARDASS
ncbi:MAG TPA: SUMF1/EgtB/PvdO family nonheme iron enzyme [Candidatus Acidoferrum sp.]|nr:SUMF1/EgtB/PvdO family nonheme iron enzyme [Candidatus Acidoferrum sp.]